EDQARTATGQPATPEPGGQAEKEDQREDLCGRATPSDPLRPTEVVTGQPQRQYAQGRPADRQRRTEGFAPGHPDGRAEAHEEDGRSRHEEYTDRSRDEPVDEPPRGKEE